MSKEFTFAEKIRQDILLLTVSEEFLIDLEIINKKHNLPVPENEVGEDGHPLIMDNEYFHNDIQKLMKKYSLPESHEFTFGSFLMNGHLNFNMSTDFWHLNPYCVSQNTKDCITLKIYPETTLKDIQKNWPRIKYAKDKILNRGINKIVRIENLERDLEILKLKRTGKKSKEIADLINKDKRFKKVILGYEDIPKIIQRLKNMAKKSMAHKKS